MIIDSKQLSNSGAVKMDSNAAGGLVQLTDESIDVITSRLGDTPASKAVIEARLSGTLLKAAAYVDKKTNELKIINFKYPG